MKKHCGARRDMKISRVLIFGVIFSFITLFTVSILLSGLIMTTANPTGSAKRLSLVALLVSAAISGFTVAKRKSEGGAMSALFTSLIFAGLVLVISLISSRGSIKGVVFMNLLCYVMISVFFSFFAKKRQRRRRR